MNERHRISPEQLGELASGACSPALLQVLHDGQLSRQLLLIRHIADRAGPDGPVADALAVLDAARARDPEAAAWVLLDPMVAAWTARVVRRLHAGPAPAGEAELGVVAAAAAARAGLDADLEARCGRLVVLPTWGAVAAPGAGEQPVRIRARSGRLRVSAGGSALTVPSEPGTQTAGWLPARRLRSAVDLPSAEVTLEDLSPYRDVFHAPVAGRLSDREVGGWQRLFAEAAGLLARRAANRAAEIGGSLRTIVPLREADDSRLMQSATARHVFGALGTTRPESAAALAVTMVHEYQHSKLNAILQIEPFFGPDDRTLYFAPWRADPRPLWGLFHGVFAFLAVAEVMHQLRAEPGREYAAERGFAKVRAQLRPAMDTLLAAPGLTDAGRYFAGLLEKTLTRWEGVAVSHEAAAAAVAALNADRARWRSRR